MAEELIAKVRAAGVVGAGGAGFPTHVKLASAAQIIVVNGAECEPLLRVDQLLMEKKAESMVVGLLAVIKATGASEGLVALKKKYKTAIAALEKAIISKPIRLHILEDFYPAGDEHLTVYEATGRLVPQGEIPLKVSCIVVNVETLVNIAAALEDKPVTDTWLTVAGAVPNPFTAAVPVGMPVAELIKLAGLINIAGIRVIDGGPMMGRIISDLNQPVTKNTKGLVVLPKEHGLIKRRTLPVEKVIKQAKGACIQCRYCTDLCPRYLLGHKLEPHKIMRGVKYLDIQDEVIKMAFACSECGICEQYACIMGLSPRTVNAMIKQELTKAGIKPAQAPDNQTRHKLQPERKIPVKRLVSRLGLAAFDKSAPLAGIEQAKIGQVEIMLKQHIGVPAQPVVQPGQPVKHGELIAVIPVNALGANIHASITGIVTAVSDKSIIITAIKEGGEL